MAKWLSCFRAGDIVQVRDKEEILATLDHKGCLDGMPFMPEMLRFCGQRFRVSSVAHKTCETAHKTYKGRRLDAAVHLEGLRCDGSAHGGCQADCNLFWKDAWLRPANGSSGAPSPTGAAAPTAIRYSEGQLAVNTRSQCAANGREPCYTCQATELYRASRSMAWWDPRQYVLDVVSRNHSASKVVRVLWLAAFRWLQPRVPLGYRIFKSFYDWMYLALSGRTSPSIQARIPRGSSTPTGRLDLQPGERVRIKSQEKIEETLNQAGQNRGLDFDPEEMSPYCGGVFQVRARISMIIDERTGNMLRMKQPCVTLEGVVCSGQYARCRLMCPRSVPPYWREIWLERPQSSQPGLSESKPAASIGK